jgi:hypothetical protein
MNLVAVSLMMMTSAARLFAADGAKFSESWKQKLVCQKGTTNCATADSGKLSIKGSGPLEGVDTSGFNSATSVRLTVGGRVMLEAVLGDDPAYVVGNSTAAFALSTTAQTYGLISFKWSDTELAVSAKAATSSSAAGFGAPVLADQFEGLNTAAISTNITIQAEVGDAAIAFLTSVTGSAKTKPKVVGTQSFPLTAVKLKGAGVVTTPLPELVALAGRNQSIVLGDTLILNAAAQGAVGEPSFAWTLDARPVGSVVELTASNSASQVIVPDVVGEYVLSLIATDGPRSSEPAVVVLTALAEAPAPPTMIAVAGIEFTAQVNGLVDPSSAMILTFEGPVDPASLSTNNVTLHNNETPLAVNLSFDEAENALTVTPQSPLPLNRFFRLAVTNATATVSPFVFTPFSTTFLTPAQEFSMVGGSVHATDRSPLPMVTVRIAGMETKTDDNGQFLFRNVPTGQQLLDIDPSTIEDDSVVYTPLHFIMNIEAGPAVNDVGYPIVLTVVDTNAVIQFPSQTVLTSAKIPGLEIDCTGTTITDPHTGLPYSGPITISPVVPTDVPMPFPEVSEIFWTIQPGGLLISPGAKMTVPLPIPMQAGDEIDLWAFDHESNQWVNYGIGLVNSNGTTATSAPGSGLPFTGWHGVLTRQEVTRDVGSPLGTFGPIVAGPMTTNLVGIAGTVVDASNAPLHGVQVAASGGKTVYTDYDNGKKSFDGTIDGDFLIRKVLVGYNVSNTLTKTFVVFRPNDVTITACAKDILGNAFATNVTIDIDALANTNAPDGALPAVITNAAISPMRLAKYVVVDTNKHIHLHMDQADNSRSHHVKARLSSDLVAQSARYQAEVRAVTGKLASMGFRESHPTGAFLNVVSVLPKNSPGETAIRLYQTVWFHGGRSASFDTVDREVGPTSLRALNSTNGVIWTRNNPFTNGFTYASPPTALQWHHGTIPEKLFDLTTKSVITDGSRATGGSRGYGQTHWAGGELDLRAISTNGTSYTGIFYRRLTYIKKGKVTRTRVVAPNDTPRLADEYTDADRAAGMTEQQAAESNKTWRTQEEYSRARTQDFINEIRALSPSQIIYNDPGITGVERLKRHHNHIHFGLRFQKTDVHPPQTDGAPLFLSAIGPAPSTNGFQLVSVEPAATSLPVDPTAPLSLEFSLPVDPATLTSETVKLVEYNSGEIIPTTFQVSDGGLKVQLVPAAELAENTSFALELSEDIRDLLGANLDLGGRTEVTSFATGLHPSVTMARLDPELISLSRSDASSGAFAISGIKESGEERDITDSLSELILLHESGGLLDAAQDGQGNLTRVYNGRSTLVALVEPGLTPSASVEANLLAEPVVLTPLVNLGQPVNVQFQEDLNTAAVSLLSAQVLDEGNDVIVGSVTLKPDKRTVAFTPGVALPRFVPLVLEVVLRITDAQNHSLEVVVRSSILATGVLDTDADADGDGLPDAIENLLAPCAVPDNPDTDDDGIPDAQEDCDEDGLTNLEELTAATNPGNADTDADGRLDGLETVNGCDPSFAEFYSVSGRVVDDLGAAVPGATVRVGGAVQTTDGAGMFSFVNLNACPVRTNRVAASLTVGVTLFEGLSAPFLNDQPAVNVGDIVLAMATGPAYPCPKGVGGSRPRQVAVGDINNDGLADAVLANDLISGGVENYSHVSVLLARGDHTFEPELTVPASFEQYSVALADLDDDGNLDLVTGMQNITNQYEVLIFLGNGDGTFALSDQFNSAADPRTIAVGDVNNDGALDLVVAQTSANAVLLALGNGDGTFQTPQAVDVGGQNVYGGVALGHFNSDTNLDLVAGVGVEFTFFDLAVRLGNGDGTFQPVSHFGFDAYPVAIAVGDLNADTFPDIVTPSFADSVKVYLGSSNGMFSAEQQLAVGSFPRSVVLVDVNDDGILDIAAADPGSSAVSVRLGNGNGTFQSQLRFAVGYSPSWIAAGDLDGDGALELLASNQSSHGVDVLIGRGDGSFDSFSSFGDQLDELDSVAVADLNHDGAPDLISADLFPDSQVVVRLGNSNGTFQAEQRFDVGQSPFVVRVADLNADGDLDVVTANQTVNEHFSALLGNGDGTFPPAQHFPGTYGEDDMVLADVNGDDFPDIIAAAEVARVAVLLGVGDGTFGPEQKLPPNAIVRGIAVADVTGDDVPDIVTGNLPSGTSGARRFALFRGNGDGTFQDGVSFGDDDIDIDTGGIALADINGDGGLDIVATLNDPSSDVTAPEEVMVLLGNGKGSFGSEQRFAIGGEPRGLALADLDGDTALDLVVGNTGSGDISVLRGNGDGTFQPERRFSTAFNANSVALADLNNDGQPDIVVAGRRITVLLHR